MSICSLPLTHLKEGRWIKLICGASYQHLPAIRDLALVYGLAGVDCIDVAADPAVIEAVKDAFEAILHCRQTEQLDLPHNSFASAKRPFLMVSFSDGEDPHFRKATFDASTCPIDCPRPCESICPAAAIAFTEDVQGVLKDRCYGCGRCLPVCPIQHIQTVTHATSPAAIAPDVLSAIDAVELHTQVGRYDAFMQLWSVIRPYLPHLSLVSISCQDHEHVIDYLWQIYRGIQPLAVPLIWQTDGRSMSGDLGKGTTHATLRFAQKVLQSGPPGFVQLAGGTNNHTVTKLDQLTSSSGTHWFNTDRAVRTGKPTFGGIAYGSFARRLIMPLLDEWSPSSSGPPSTNGKSTSTREDIFSISNAYASQFLEDDPPRLSQAVRAAQSLVAPLKAFQSASPLPPPPQYVGVAMSNHEARSHC